MKTKLAILLLPLLVWSCSPKETTTASDQTDTAAPTARGTGQPASASQFQFVPSPQCLERKQIEREALTLFTNKDYAGLDALAARYRTSRERYADGMWKLAYVYIGIEPSDEAPDSDWEARLDQVTDWIHARENSITPRVLKARLQVSYAWKIRGGGWAESVKETQWKKYFERLQQAARTLRGANQLAERCPVYWSTWQRAALGLQMERKDYDAIFAAATTEFPDYWYYYSTRAVFLLPRWYGEAGEWERDLTKSADHLGGVNGDMLYAQVAWSTQQYGSGINVFEGKQISWERVHKGLEQLLILYPDSVAARNERVILAGLADDKPKAQAFLTELNKEADPEIWNDREQLEQFVHWAEGN